MRWWRVIGVLALIGAEALLYGYSYPFFSLALEKRELANWLIGLIATRAAAGTIVVAPPTPCRSCGYGMRPLVAVID
jgi:hypothetical protein